EKLTWFEPYLQIGCCGVTRESLLHFFAEVIDVDFFIIFSIRNFKTSAKINRTQFREVRNDVEQHFDTLDEHIRVLDIATGVNMQVVDVDRMFLHHAQHFIEFLDRYAELTLVVPRGYLEIATCKYVWPQANANGVIMSVSHAKFLQIGNAVDIDLNSQFHCLSNLFEVDTVGSVENLIGFKAGMQREPCFVYRTTVDICADGEHVS